MPADRLVLDFGPKWHPGLLPVVRRSPAEPGAGGGRSRPVILMIEDDPDISGMYRLQLERDGFIVHSSGDGRVGLELARTLKPDLVLLDLRLPSMDGFEVLRQLREQEPCPPVLVVSNYGDPDMVRRAESLGAADYVVKSRIIPDELSRRARRWTGSAGPPLQ